jgi:O-succinylbenzoic acid--CoA ligase
MDLIIKNGRPTDLLKKYPEELFWVDAWLSDKNEFEFQTSGSTGPPKTIVFSRNQILRSAKRTSMTFGWYAGMNALHSLPMSYVAGRMNILRALICEQTLWRVETKVNFTLVDFNEEVEIHWWTLTPAMLDSILNLKELNLHHAKLLVGGGRLSERLVQLANEVDFPIWESYGAAETLTHIALRKLNGLDAQNGFSTLPQVKLEMNEIGVLITDELLANQVQSLDKLEMLSHGQFLIVGRTDNLINSGGVKIYPSQVETIIEEHVEFESFVKGTTDDVWGEVVTWVVPEHESIPADWPSWFDSTPILRPKKIERVKELPKNKNGKWKRK